jgi:protein-tyrosine phosphatase
MRHIVAKTLEYNEIIDGIFIGTNKCCRMHLDALLKKGGVTADMSLEETVVDRPLGVEVYVWIPVKAHTAPTQRQLDFGADALKKLVEQKSKIYVHCKNGHGRAPTMVAAYLIRKGMSADDAEALIKSKRPSIHIEGAQREALRTFEKT